MAIPPPSRLIKIRHVAGHGAAIAVTPYLLIKILWTFGLFLPTGEMDEANWRVINATTAVLAAIGILLAPVLGPAAMARDQEAGSADVWAYEQGLVMMSLVGVGIGLPLALAGYTRARWPEAVSGPLDVGMLAGATRDLQFVLARIVAAGTLALGVIKVFWAAGGTLGLDPAMLHDRDVWWHMLSLSTGVWALAGTWGLLALVSRRGSRGFLLPMAAAWVSSGMLFSYNLYDLLAGTMPDALPNPEYPLAQVLTTAAGMILGVMMGMIILLVLHDRQRAMRGVS